MPSAGVSPTRIVWTDELPKSFWALHTEENIDLRDFVLLALFSGVRHSNIREMCRDQLDLQGGFWTIPDLMRSKENTA